MRWWEPPRKALKGLIRVSMLGFKRGPHITRHVMYKRLATVVPPISGPVLSVSESLPLCRQLGLDLSSVIEANYPDVNILNLPFPENQFACVVSDQVLEHVEGTPQQAIDECFRVLRPGGIAIHTTCLVHPIHECPSDFWRYTPEGLRFLHRGFSEVIQCDGWGNPFAWVYIGLGLRFDGVPLARWHPVHKLAHLNDPNWPITTWIVARK